MSNIEKILTLLFRDIKGNILDLGCGRGKITKKIINLCGENSLVIGLDIDLKRLREALNGLKEYGNVSLICSTSTKIPLREDIVDHIVSFMTLHELYEDEIDATLDEAHRVLKSGGKFIVGDKIRYKPASPSEELPLLTEYTYHKAIFYATGRRKWGLHEASQIINIIERRGFRLEDIYHTITRKVSPEEFFKSWGRDTLRYIKCIRDDENRDEITKLVDRIRDIAERHGYGPVKILFLVFKKWMTTLR